MRELLDGATYKVWSGIDHLKPKMEAFEEKKHFLQILEEVRLEHPFELLTFSILEDRIYLVLRPLHKLDNHGRKTDEWEQLPVIMQRIKWRYAKWFNIEHKICGHVWKCRYASTILFNQALIDAAVLEVDQYAVEEKAASEPEEYVFSGSYFHIHEIFDVEDAKTRGSFLKKLWRHRKKDRFLWGKDTEVVVERLESLKKLAKMRPFFDTGSAVRL
jgi:REP element-mobilizing transposase RayT